MDSLDRRRRRRRRRESFASTCLDPALRAALGQRTVREDAELATRIVNWGDIAAGEFLREVFEGRRKNNLLLLRYSVSWSFRVQCCRDPVIVMSIESVGYCSDLTDSPAVRCV